MSQRTCETTSRGFAQRTWTALAALMSAVALLAAVPAAADWPMFGANLENTATANPGGITQGNVSGLLPKWTFTTGGDVSARAAVVNGIVYFPDWGGNLWAVDGRTGQQIWGKQIKQYFSSDPAAPQVNSRTSPAVANGVVYIGTQEGAYLLAINAATGALIWKTQMESPANDFAAIVTASPVVSDGLVYTGVASNQEAAAAFVPPPFFVCCTGRGSVVAVNAATGAIAWKTYMVPKGYSGGGVWGSNFVVDTSRGTLFTSTGNNYSESVDPAYVACRGSGGTKTSCASPDNHVDSIVALNLKTGAIKWASKFVTWNQPPFLAVDGSDDWNVACFLLPNGQPGVGPNCPADPGPDYDFASAPNLITYHGKDGKKTILGAGQKSGIYFAIDPDTGAELWHTQVGPGSSLGGMEWGSASDGERIYVSIANLYGIPSAVGSAGSWAALDPATGAILWQKPDPSAAIALGPLTVAKGVVYAPSMAGIAGQPSMLALDAATGNTLWSFAAGSSVNAGASIADNTVYWGSGYAHLGIPGYTANNKFYAFSIDGK